jgi:L-threonylcarbamoyladenylate synthase
MIVPDNRQSHNQAAKLVAAGGVIAFRTDTFYGLGADPFNPNAIARIRKLKGRQETKPILLLISDADEVARFIATRSETFASIAKRFWPGPLTLIGLACPELPEELTAGTKTIGLRLPNEENVRALVRACGGALTATSANVSGKQPARTAKEVEEYFPEGIDLIIDSGEVTATQPSTVVDSSGLQARLIREGAIPRKQLEEFLEPTETNQTAKDAK